MQPNGQTVNSGPRHKMTSLIGFIGDSFCASYGLGDWRAHGSQTRQKGTDTITYTNRVIKHFNHAICPYGFEGASWWHSRERFIQDFDWRSKEYNEFLALIFLHTEHSRINCLNNNDLPKLGHSGLDPGGTVEQQQAVAAHYRHLYDDKFHCWAQEQWFREIHQRFSHLKTIHLHCFPDTVPLSHLLPGCVYTTPLIHISVGELSGTETEISKQLSRDTRYNHMSQYNNQVLADVIIDAIDNYTPGTYKLPMEKFNRPNPNAENFPHGTYWNK